MFPLSYAHMKRKVIQLAGKTFVITLPSTWIKKFGIKKGDEVDIDELNTELVVTTDKAYDESEIEVDIRGLDQRTIFWMCSALHKYGYNQIHLTYDKPAQLQQVRDRVKNLFTGFIVAETTDNRITLKSVSKDIESEFDPTLRRAFRVALSMGEELYGMLKTNNFSKEDELFELEITNNQLTNFCQRLLNKRGYKEYKKTTFYYVIVWNLEKVCDNYKYILNDLKQTKTTKISRELLEFLKGCNEYFKAYYELLYNYNREKLQQLSIQRDDLKLIRDKVAPKSPTEIKIYSHLLTTMTQIHDFSASMIAVN